MRQSPPSYREIYSLGEPGCFVCANNSEPGPKRGAPRRGLRCELSDSIDYSL